VPLGSDAGGMSEVLGIASLRKSRRLSSWIIFIQTQVGTLSFRQPDRLHDPAPSRRSISARGLRSVRGGDLIPISSPSPPDRALRQPF